MTVIQTTPDLQHGAGAPGGVKVSNYVLFENEGPAFDRTVTWSYHDGSVGPDGVQNEALVGPLAPELHPLVLRAMAQWESVSGIRFVQVADSPQSDLRIGYGTESYFATSPWVIHTGGRVPAGLGGYELIDNEIIRIVTINPTYDFSDQEFHDVILHELGHAIGIDHSDVPGVVMSGPPHSPYHHLLSVLSPDDIAAAQAIWGPPGDPPPDLSETGRNFHSEREIEWRGTSGDDTLVANQYLAHDVFAGGFGADSIQGGWGDDTLMGNGVYWTNWNNSAHDYWSRGYTGEDDADTIFGGPGNDFINGNAGLDYLDGGPGNDTIYGGQNAGAWTAGKTRTTTIHLREGHDTLKGGPGDDFLNGNMGTDILYGGPGNDSMRGGQDEDLLYGEEDDDTLWGDLEGDTLDGGPGADHIICGNDTGAGDGHVDHVHFKTGEAAGDVVYGLEPHDVLWIDGAIATQDQVAALGVTFVPMPMVSA